MKIKHIVLASAILVSVSSFAQKDELKKLKKIYEKTAPTVNDVSEYKATLNALQPLATAESDVVYYGFYKAMSPIVEIMSLGLTATPQQKAQIATPSVVSEVEKGLNATLDYEKKVGKKVYTDDILAKIALFKPELLNAAIALGDAKKYKESASLLHSIYQLDKKDVDMLFYAAGYSVNAEDYEKAIEYYNELKKINYSGESIIYFATNKTSKTEESFGDNKSLRDISVNSAKTHEKPRDEKTPSKRGEIYKNIALILVQKGKTQEAISAVQEARKVNPDDESLLMTEMDLYLKMNDFDTYTKLVNEALAKNPNNADLVFNLGVVAGNANKLDEAEKHYKKAIEINPNYFNAYLNYSELKLRADEKFVEEMNKLGTSEKDNKRYTFLKSEREKNFKSILPYLEKAYDLEPTNDAAKKTLLSVYNALEMTDKYKALKAK
ncbi:tetratricopeptide repeat protein [Flavobacterium dankookense]|uniref:Tetratricopeptide repeat protein n=1 Tax=Flavobacterium dankookense TaxID=706186 RepID=A0A4R6QDF7_9FLAO|nr:tetratricopeptide repeat protein [Flavobacterium dankookense]TDP60854.1 tetratricopeptide repeat protein [Flavobacterium dankookense]